MGIAEIVKLVPFAGKQVMDFCRKCPLQNTSIMKPLCGLFGSWNILYVLCVFNWVRTLTFCQQRKRQKALICPWSYI